VHLQQADRIDRGDPNPSRHAVAQTADPIVQLAEFRQQLPASLEVHFARRSQLQGPLGPVDEQRPQPLFQHVDRLANGRLRNLIRLGRLRKTAASHHIAK